MRVSGAKDAWKHHYYDLNLRPQIWLNKIYLFKRSNWALFFFHNKLAKHKTRITGRFRIINLNI